MRTHAQWIAAALIALCTGTVAATETLAPGDFALRLPLAVSQTDGVHALELTEQLYLSAHSRELADLRVFNAKGEALPWVLLPAVPAEPQLGGPVDLTLVSLPAEADRQAAMLQSYALRVERDGQRAVVEMGPATSMQPPAGSVGGYLIDARKLKDRDGQLQLVFDAAAADFAGRVDILGSDDLVSWRPIASGPLALNRSLGEPVERRSFDVVRPPAFLRLQWAAHAVPQLVGARFSDQSVPTPILPRTQLTLQPDPEHRGSFIVDLPRALPVERLHLRPQTMNESFRMEVHQFAGSERRRRHFLSRTRADQWTSVGLVDVTRVMRSGAEVIGEPLRYSTAGARLRLTPVGTGQANIPIVEAEWRPARIAFVTRAPAPYFLAIGNPDAMPGPQLDLNTVLTSNDRSGNSLPTAHVAAGSAESVASRAAEQQRVQRIGEHAKWSRFVLWSALLVAVGTLAWMAWRLSMQLRRSEQ